MHGVVEKSPAETVLKWLTPHYNSCHNLIRNLCVKYIIAFVIAGVMSGHWRNMWADAARGFDLNPAARQQQKQTKPLPDDTPQPGSSALLLTIVLFFFQARRHSKNVSKYEANTVGNECYCSCRGNGAERHNKLYLQDQMAGVMGFKQPAENVCVCVCACVCAGDRGIKSVCHSMLWNARYHRLKEEGRPKNKISNLLI